MLLTTVVGHVPLVATSTNFLPNIHESLEHYLAPVSFFLLPVNWIPYAGVGDPLLFANTLPPLSSITGCTLLVATAYH